MEREKEERGREKIGRCQVSTEQLILSFAATWWSPVSSIGTESPTAPWSKLGQVYLSGAQGRGLPACAEDWAFSSHHS